MSPKSQQTSSPKKQVAKPAFLYKFSSVAHPKLPPYLPSLWCAMWLRRCVICQQRHAYFRLICQVCQMQIPLRLAPRVIEVAGEPSLRLRLYPMSYYQYPINRIIHQFKENEDIQALLALIALIRTLPKPVGCHATNTAIVSIPTTQTRIRRRGFNPTDILARHLAHHWSLPLYYGVARRDGARQQRGLNRQQRLNNMQSEFWVSDAKLPCQQLIIFDDVVTTGATLTQMASCLKAEFPSVKLMAVCLAHGSIEFGLPYL